MPSPLPSSAWPLDFLAMVDDVEVAVTVEVAHCQRLLRIVNAKPRAQSKAALAIAQQRLNVAEGVRVVLADHDVAVAIVVEVAHGHASGTTWEIVATSEGAIAVAEQDADSPSVELAVTRSRLPSLFQSPAASERGWFPTLNWCAAAKPPVPLPSSDAASGAFGCSRLELSALDRR